MSSKINCYVIEEGSIVPYDEYYSGSFVPGDNIRIELQIWNNRWGTEDVEDLIDANMIIGFDTYEDNSFINICNIYVDGVLQTITKDSDKSYVSLGTLRGYSNDGNPNGLQNKGNYVNVTIQIGPLPNNAIKGLKNMYIDIQ